MLNKTESALVQAAVDLIDRKQGHENHSVSAAALGSAGNAANR